MKSLRESLLGDPQNEIQSIAGLLNLKKMIEDIMSTKDYALFSKQRDKIRQFFMDRNLLNIRRGGKWKDGFYIATENANMVAGAYRRFVIGTVKNGNVHFINIIEDNKTKEWKRVFVKNVYISTFYSNFLKKDCVLYYCGDNPDLIDTYEEALDKYKDITNSVNTFESILDSTDSQVKDLNDMIEFGRLLDISEAPGYIVDLANVFVANKKNKRYYGNIWNYADHNKLKDSIYVRLKCDWFGDRLHMLSLAVVDFKNSELNPARSTTDDGVYIRSMNQGTRINVSGSAPQLNNTVWTGKARGGEEGYYKIGSSFVYMARLDEKYRPFYEKLKKYVHGR